MAGAVVALARQMAGGLRLWRTSGPSLRRILSYLAPFRRQGLLALVCSASMAVATLLPMLALRAVVNHLEHPKGSFGTVAILVAIGALAAVAAGLLNVAETYLTTSIGKSVVALLRQQLFDRLLGQSVGYFAKRRAGELMSRVLNDVEGIDSVIGSAMLSLVTASLTLSASVAVMFVLSWQLSLAALALYPVVGVVLRLTRRALSERSRAVREQFATLTAHLQEVLSPSAIMVVKSFGQEHRERSAFRIANERMRALEVDAGRAARWAASVMFVLRFLGPVAIALLGSYLVAVHQLSLGSMVAFAAIAAMGLGGASQGVMSASFAIFRSLPMWERVFEVLDEPRDVAEDPGAISLVRPAGSVRFDSVSFSYPGQGRPALQSVSVDVAPGEVVALVGPSGAGKTTFINLVARFYDPQEGAVMIDGHDLRTLTLDSLSDAVGLVLQDVFLFHATLRENLLYGRPGATELELENAVRSAALEPVVAGLPDGYETVVGDRGHRLSGGERQRVAIARAILKDPPILVLDEATSHLDSLAEELIQSALAELLVGRTALVVAHRLSTVRAADRIVVLEGGRVAEVGSHEQLRRSNGLYATLYNTQFYAGASDRSA